MSARNYTFRISAEGVDSFARDLGQLGQQSEVAQRALETLLNSSPQLANVLTRAQDATTRAADGMKGFAGAAAAAAAAADKAAQAQARINAALGVRGPDAEAYERRAADVAAYGQQLDALRAKYVPLFAVQQQHKAQLEEIARAERVGAIAAAEAAEARQRAQRQLAASTAAFNRGGALFSAPGGAGVIAGQLGFQVQDAAVQLAGGQQAAVVIAQQGSQLAGIFGPGGAMAGAALAIAAIVAQLALGKSETEKLSEALEANAKHWKEAESEAERYRAGLAAEAEAVQALTTYYGQLTEAQRALERIRVEKEREELGKREAALRASVGNAGSRLTAADPQQQAGLGTQSAGFAEAAAALREFAASGDVSREGLARLVQQVDAAAGAAGPLADVVRKVRDELLGQVAPATELERAQARLAAMLRAITGDAPGAAAALGGVGQAARTQLSPLEELNKKLGETAARLSSFRAAGAAGLAEAERQLALERQLEASRNAEIARLQTPGGGGLSLEAARGRAAETEGARRQAAEAEAAAALRLRQEQALAKAEEQRREAERIARLPERVQAGERARAGATAQADELGLQGKEREKFILDQVTAATVANTKARGDNAQIAAAQAAGALRVAEAAEQGRAAMLRAAAAAEAHTQKVKGAAGSEQELARAILEKNAAEAASKGAETVRAMREQLAAAQALAAADAAGPHAVAQAELAAKVRAATLELRAQAEVTQDPKTREALKAEADEIERIITEEERLLILRRDNAALRSQGQQLETLQADRRLIGASAADRARELAVLRERQKLVSEKADLEHLTEEQQRRLANAAAIADETTALEAQRSSLQELARIGENALDRLGQAMVTAFAEGKGEALDFGKIAKGVLASVAADAVKLAVVNPISNSLFGTSRPTIFSAVDSFGASTGLGTQFSQNLRVANAGAGAANGTGTGGAAGGGGGGFSSTDALGLANRLSGGSGSSMMPGFVTSFLNTPIYTTAAGEMATTALPAGQMGPVASATDLAGMGQGLTIGQAAGGAIGVAGGLYGVYSGLQRGGVGGYTSAAGGAIGAASAAYGIGASAGLFSAAGALAAIPVYGWIAAAVLAIVGSLLPGAKPSNREGNAVLDLGDGTLAVGGQDGDKYSGTNRDAAVQTTQQLGALADKFDALLKTATGGKVAVQVGDRDGVIATYDGTARRYDRTEDEMKRLMDDFTRWLVAKAGTESSDANIRAIVTADHGDVDGVLRDLQWLTTVYEPLGKAAGATKALYQRIGEIVKPFDEATLKARELGLAETALAERRAAAVAEVEKTFTRETTALALTLRGRALRASGKAGDAERAELADFDFNAPQQREALEAQLRDLDVLGSQYAADRFAELEAALGAERLAIVKRYNDAIAAEEKQAAAEREAAAGRVANTVSGLVSYARSLSTGDTSAFSEEERYGIAATRFNDAASAARNGSASALASLQGYADALLSTSRDLYGSGTGYRADFERVLAALEGVSGQTGDALTASALADSLQTQTTTLAGELQALRAEVVALRREVAQGNAMPARVA